MYRIVQAAKKLPALLPKEPENPDAIRAGQRPFAQAQASQNPAFGTGVGHSFAAIAVDYPGPAPNRGLPAVRVRPDSASERPRHSAVPRSAHTLQAKWAFAQPEQGTDNLLGALLTRAAERSDLQASLSNVHFLIAVTGQDKFAQQIQPYLKDTFESEAFFSATYLLKNVFQYGRQIAKDPDPLTDDADFHDEDLQVEAPEEAVELEDLVLSEFDSPGEDEGLRNVFASLARRNGFEPTLETYKAWYSSGTLTREGFRSLFTPRQFRRADPLQRARTPNTPSYQDEYLTHNFGKFEDITYQRDNVGNIAFASPLSHTTWQNPIQGNSMVELSAGSKDKTKGIVRNGNMVKIAGASRSQHFSIANRIKKIPETGSPPGWTWHHLSARYKMLLVDRKTHSKHGHNGGVFVW